MCAPRQTEIFDASIVYQYRLDRRMAESHTIIFGTA